LYLKTTYSLTNIRNSGGIHIRYGKVIFVLLIVAVTMNTLGCSERPAPSSVIVGNGNGNNTTSGSTAGGNSIVLDMNNTARNDSERLVVVDDGIYKIMTGRITSAVISRDTYYSSVFTFSDGSVISVNNAQRHQWTVGKMHRIRAYPCFNGYDVDNVTILD
jgi:hypothetical protein